MSFVILIMVCPDTRQGWSYIKKNLETMSMSHLQHDIPKSNIHTEEWMNAIYIDGETYS